VTSEPLPVPEEQSSDFDPLDGPAEEFLARYRRGERPALTEYEQRFPDLAGRIRALFPALIEMEQAGPPSQGDTFVPGRPARPEPVPTRIGEFRILRRVGEGGMGVVYEAVQESLGRHVALKVLPPNRTGTYLERFRREARAAAKLHHTNIVPVFGVGLADGLHFYAMQFIPGQGLDSVLDEVRRLRIARSSGAGHPSGETKSGVARSVAENLVTGTFPPAADPPPAAPPSSGSHTELASQPEARYYREVARLGVQAAEALAYAHSQGVLHRDIKPSNLLLDLHGTVWVTDFGLAKAGDEQDLTNPGDIVGTLRYMAPERFRGKADARSEVYALGITLYELLTLRPAFGEDDRLALIEDICRTTPPRPRKIDRQIPRDLETIVLKAIDREPTRRYATAAALADDLRRFLTDRTITARRASVPEQLWRAARRNPAIASLVGFIVAASVLAAVLFAAQSGRLRVALKASEDDRREARLRRLDSMIAEAHSKILGRKPGQRFESLALLEEATALARELDVLPEKTAELRNATAAALAVPDLHLRHTWAGFPAGSEGFDVSGDHAVYARTHENGTCVVARVADNTEVCRVPTPPAVADRGCTPFLSDDGRVLLLHGGNREVQVWRLRPSSPERVAVVEGVYHTSLRPDGQRAVFTHTDGSLSVCDLSGGPTTVRFLPEGRSKEWGSALHPTEPRVVLWCDAEGVIVRDTRTGKVLARFTGYTPVGAAWHPDGSPLVVANDRAELRVYDAKTFRETATWPNVGVLPGLRFNPSGDRLAGLSWPATTLIVDTQTGRTVHVGPPFRDGTVLRWSPDGRRLAGPVLGGRIGVWEVGDGREFRILQRLPVTPHPQYGPTAVHPGGRIVAVSVKTGVTLWDLETGRQVADLPFEGPRGPWQPVFDPDGALWTPTEQQTLRWRVREAAGHPGRFTLGPPERVPVEVGVLGRSADARVWVGVARFREEGFIWRPDRPYDRGSLPTGLETSHVDVSPDGRWATIAHHTTITADLWDVRARERVRRLYTRSGNALPAFSPDGKWLWVNSDGGRLLRVGTWEPGPVTGRAEGRPAFTADGRVMALESGAGSVRLVETATGRELVRLDNPHQDPLNALAFTPDGSRLVGCSNGNTPGVHVWELRLIRRQLAARGLDWDAPSLPDQAPTRPVEVRVPLATPPTRPPKGEDPQKTIDRANEYLAHDPGLADPYHFRAHAWEDLGAADRAEADFDEAVRLRPGDPDIRECRAFFRFDRGRYAEAAADLDRCLADAPGWKSPAALLDKVALWHLVLAPPGGRDPLRGLDLARRAVAGDPKSALPRVVLGIALLRAGRPAEAVTELNRACADGDGRFDDLADPALALAYVALGDRPGAADALRRAADARGRLSARRLPDYLHLARQALEAEALAAYVIGLPWLTPAGTESR
jgi:serine/threonine protein kinase/WD40 repeat protein/Tfp pilus assembly protein PilF